jgi:molecular chaperone GrpE
VEPQIPETSQDPAAPEGTPTAAETTGQPDLAAETVAITEPAAEDTATTETTAQAQVAELEEALRGRTEDLQRLQAEYVNYKRRVDRDRDVARNAGIEAVLLDLMSVLDNLRVAQEHEEMTGGLKLMVDELDRIAVKYGLETYGAKGEVFDPTVHDALMQAPMPGVGEPTVLDVMQVGYRLRGRVLRAARVAVGMPTGDTPPANTGTSAQTQSADTPESAGSSTITDDSGDPAGQ